MSVDQMWTAMQAVSRRRESAATGDPDHDVQRARWQMVLMGLDLDVDDVSRVALARARATIENNDLSEDLLAALWMLVLESFASGVMFEQGR